MSFEFWKQKNLELRSRIPWTKQILIGWNQKKLSAVNEQNEKGCQARSLLRAQQIQEEFQVRCPAELLEFSPDHHQRGFGIMQPNRILQVSRRIPFAPSTEQNEIFKEQ